LRHDAGLLSDRQIGAAGGFASLNRKNPPVRETRKSGEINDE